LLRFLQPRGRSLPRCPPRKVWTVGWKRGGLSGCRPWLTGHGRAPGLRTQRLGEKRGFGPPLVSASCQHGVNMASTWCQHSANMASTWCHIEVDMVSTRCRHGVTMVSSCNAQWRHGASIVSRPFGCSLVPLGRQHGVSLASSWCEYCVSMVSTWCPHSTNMASTCCHMASARWQRGVNAVSTCC
jgi:hypothetical protein